MDMETFPNQETVPERSRHEERIEEGVWRPGILEAFSGKVAAGSTTKLLERRKDDVGHTPRLRITGDPKRVIEDRDGLEEALRSGGSEESVDDYRGRKISAGVQLTRMLRRLDPESDPRDMLKTRLTHGTDIVVVDEAYAAKPKQELVEIKADGLITNLKHLPVMVAAADCAPLIIYDPENEAVGVFHSGYRGTEANIAGKGIRAMMESFGSAPENLRVSVGPYADGQSYEIGKDLRERMRSAKDDSGENLFSKEDLTEMFSPHPSDESKLMYDNGKAIEIQMRKAGVPDKQIEVSRMSTMRDNETFSSDRKEGFADRDTLLVMAVLK